MLQVSQLRTFRAVLEFGSFAAAGEHVGLTPSAVSQQIAALEKALGVALFERLARSIRPTNAALHLKNRIDVVLRQVDTLEREARALARGVRGVVRVGSFPTASARLLPAALTRLAATRRDIDVVLDEGEPDELLTGVQFGSLDLALVYAYNSFTPMWPSGVTATPIVVESLLLLTSRQGETIAPDLSNAGTSSWVSSREDTVGARCLDLLCNTAGFRPDVRYRSNDYDVVRALVSRRLGIAVIPALAHAADEVTQAAPVAIPKASRTVYLVHRGDSDNPLLRPVIQAFMTTRHLELPYVRPA